MPTISYFLGIYIRMYYEDHNPPHFHAFYNEFHAIFDIRTGEMLDGDFPRTAKALVEQWCNMRQSALLKNWEKAQNAVVLDQVEPLE